MYIFGSVLAIELLCPEARMQLCTYAHELLDTPPVPINVTLSPFYDVQNV